MSGPGPILAGKILFVAGRALSENLHHHRVDRLPYGLAPYVEQLDLVGYTYFYGGPPAATLTKLRKGIQHVIFDRVTIRYEGNIRRIIVRRLPFAHSMVNMQCRWLYWALSGKLAQAYDVAIMGHAENAPLARILKESGRVRYLIYDDWDYFPGYAEPKQRNLMAKCEHDFIDLADGVASVSRPLQKLRIDQGAKRSIFLPNGVDFEKFNKAHKYRKPHPPTLIYCGTVDCRWGIDLVIRALPILRQQLPNLRLIIVGSGPAENELKLLAKSIGVYEAVWFTGRLNYQQVPEIMAEADIGMATSPENEFRRYARPMKIVEYMAAGLPVIASGGGEAEKMIVESQGGVHIEFSVGALVQTLSSVLQNRARFDAMQTCGLNYARTLTWANIGKQFAQFLAETISK